MGKTRTALAGRAWKLLRLALFWARKGGLFKRRLLQDLRLVMHNHIKSLRAKRSDMIRAGEREFSLDETPIFHFKMRSRGRSARMLHIPCINPPDVDFDDEDFLFDRRRRTSCHQWSDALYEGDDDDDDGAEEEGDTSEVLVIAGDGLAHEGSLGREQVEEGGEEEENGIDVEAEEFIAKFYEQMKLQRQISLLQYNEMLIRSTN